MRMRFVSSLAALGLVSIAAAPVPAHADAADTQSLHRFKVTNQLVHWAGEGLRDGNGDVVLPLRARQLTPLPNGGWLDQEAKGSRVLDSTGKPVTRYFPWIKQVRKGSGTLVVGSDGPPLLRGKGGLMQDDGQMVAALDYRKLHYLDGSRGLFAFTKYRRYGVLNADGEVVLEPEWDNITSLHGLIRVSKYDKQGVYDSSGKQLAEPDAEVRYRAIDDSPWIARCKRKNMTCQVVDQSLQPVIDGWFKRTQYLPEAGRLLVELAEPVDGKNRALYDDDGQLVARFAAERVNAGFAEDGCLIVSQSDPDSSYSTLDGLMDLDGHWMYEPAEGQISKLSVALADRDADQPAPVRFHRQVRDDDGDSHGSVIGVDGDTLLPLKARFFRTYYPSLGVYVVELADGRLGILNGDGGWRVEPFKGRVAPNSTLPLPYLKVIDSSGDDDHELVYNLKTGESLFDKTYQYLSVETSYWPLDGHAPWPEFVVVIAKRDSHYGVIDLDEDVIVPFQYTNMEALGPWGRARATTGDGDDKQVNALGDARSKRLHTKVSDYLREHASPVSGPAIPYAGRYVPAQYQSEEAIAKAHDNGELSRAAAPTILAAARYAVLDLGMLTDADDVGSGFIEYYCSREDGFDVLLPSASTSDTACGNPDAPRLIFKAGDGDAWHCENCADKGLPANWVRQPVEPDAQNSETTAAP